MFKLAVNRLCLVPQLPEHSQKAIGRLGFNFYKRVNKVLILCTLRTAQQQFKRVVVLKMCIRDRWR